VSKARCLTKLWSLSVMGSRCLRSDLALGYRSQTKSRTQSLMPWNQATVTLTVPRFMAIVSWPTIPIFALSRLWIERFFDIDWSIEIAEGEVADGIEASGVKREDIFITSKLWNTWHHPSKVAEGLEDTLKELKTTYLDLVSVQY
jgi:hypothetical protein